MRGDAAEQVSRIARSRYWGEGDARIVVEAWRRSGMSLSGYGASHGINVKRIGRWSKRIAEGSRRDVRFHPVRLIDAVTRAAAPIRDAIELVLTDGRRVRVPPGVASDDLRRVLAVLAEVEWC